PLLNVHSRAAAREQLRLQQQQQQHGSAGGGVLSDLDSLHGLQSKDAHSALAPTPLTDSVTGSAYVSGHLTPTDQWVAVRNDSSGVISLTSSDNEDDYIDSAIGIPSNTNTIDAGRERSPMARQPLRSNLRPAADGSATEFQIPLEARSNDSSLPGEPPYYAPLPPARHWSTVVEEQGVSMDAEQAVHLLRESVVSLLSSGGSTTSSSSSAQPGGGRGSIDSSRRRYGSLQHQGAYRASRSPSRLSKVSEPSYPPSAPRRQLTADFDHFSDVALTSVTTPPHHYSHTRHHQSANAAPHRPPATTQFPTYEEFKQRQQEQQQSQVVPDMTTAASPAAVQPSAVRANELLPSTASAPAQPTARFQSHHHPLLGSSQHQLYSEPISGAMSRATYSPFASIRTVSPVLVTEDNADKSHGDRIYSPSVSRAQAEAALQQAILCPLKSLHSPRYSTSGYVGHNSMNHHADSPEKARDGAIGNGSNSCSTQTWAKYTGYAIVGFGVGTLVGILCFDMAATAAPKATRTIPIAAGF
ncbi:hypothetical protein GGH95_002800, partial [Coemansia sp. RSA 1836]